MYPFNPESPIAQVAARLPRLPQACHLIPASELPAISARLEHHLQQVAVGLTLPEQGLDRHVTEDRLAWWEDLPDPALQTVVARLFIAATRTTWLAATSTKTYPRAAPG
jgi:hypothetical protein